MGATFSRVKTWVTTEDLTYSDLNAEFDNILTYFTPSGMDDYSANVTQMQTVTDPGEVGTESLATSLAGEIARLRQIIKEITGESQWYTSPSTSLTGLANALGTGSSDNRLVSGRVRSTSDQPVFLVPHGAARTVTCDGTPTNFKYYVNGTEYTISTDVTLTNLTLAPSSNNTCLVNDSIAADQEYTKYTGENGTEIPVDNMGTEITALIGKFAAFKLAGTTTEYFIAYVKSSTLLTKAKRGYFFDSTDAPIPRAGYTDNDTITLVKLAWIFATTAGTLSATYTNPVWADDEPTSPASGDFWYDISANTWKKYDVSAFVSGAATLIGCAITDTTNTVGARSFEFSLGYGATNTCELTYESATEVRSKYQGSAVNVWGTTIKNDHNNHIWDMTTDLDTGVTEGASTNYYFYLTEDGDTIISDVRPYDRSEDLLGHYHPYHSWRCVGSAFNDGSQNLGGVNSYFNRKDSTLILPSQTVASRIEVVDRFIPISTAGGAFTKTLPAAIYWRNQVMTFMKTSDDFSVATLATVNSENILDGSASATSTTLNTMGEVVDLLSDGISIYVVRRYIPSPWRTWTPVFTGFGTVTSLNASYKRQGDTFRALVEWTNGTVTGDTVKIALPTGLTVNTTHVIPRVTTLGRLYGGNTSTATAIPASTRGPWEFTVDNAVTDGVTIAQVVDTDTTFFTPAVGTPFGNSFTQTGEFFCPITEWKS